MASMNLHNNVKWSFVWDSRKYTNFQEHLITSSLFFSIILFQHLMLITSKPKTLKNRPYLPLFSTNALLFQYPTATLVKWLISLQLLVFCKGCSVLWYLYHRKNSLFLPSFFYLSHFNFMFFPISISLSCFVENMCCRKKCSLQWKNRVLHRDKVILLFSS